MGAASADRSIEQRLVNVRNVAEARYRKWQQEFADSAPKAQESELSVMGRAVRRLERCKGVLKQEVRERCAIQRAVAREYGCPEILSKDELDKLEKQMKFWVDSSVLSLQQWNKNEFFAAGTVPSLAAEAMHNRVAHEVPAQVLSVINAELGVLRADGDAFQPERSLTEEPKDSPRIRAGLESKVRLGCLSGSLPEDIRLRAASNQAAETPAEAPSAPQAQLPEAQDTVALKPARVDGNQFGERVYRRSGDSWELRFEGKAVHVRNRKGMGYIAELLRSPGKLFACLELRGAFSENSNRRAQVDHENRAGLRPAGFDSSEILDEPARKQYKDRLDTNEKERHEAELNNNPARYDQLTEEREAIIKQLKAATGRGGRRRTFANDAEKARKAVSGAINDALKAIVKHHLQLAEHLNERIERGTSCCYKDDGIEWEI